MNVLYITIAEISHMSRHSISSDLLRQFVKNGHNVYVVASTERRDNMPTSLTCEAGCQVLRVKIGNNKRANIIEKGITNILLPYHHKKAIKKYFKGIKFDLILYPTPPVTHANTVKYIKKRDNAKTYLLLKDIFPQNAVDIGMMTKTGIKGLIYKYFKLKEKNLYALSDKIGCMSLANVDYIIKHNPEIDKNKVEVFPNSIEPQDMRVSEQVRCDIRTKYGIPLDKKVFVYGGNLSKPQGIPFVIECLKKCKDIENAYFLIVGIGTEFNRLETFINEQKPQNAKLMKRLPKEDYDKMVAACDVGLIFLDHRFTIPNFPSRMLSYMQAGLPVLACTDPNTDIGKVITEGNFGWWCESNNSGSFAETIQNIVSSELNNEIGNTAYKYLEEHYSVASNYSIIANHFT